MYRFTHNRGFTAFFAVLVSSLALAIGLTIYDLLIREIALSQIARESELAIFAADTGAECALYWDNKAPLLNDAPSVFGSSSVASWGSSPVNCNTQDITIQGPPAIDWSQFTGADSGCPSSPTNAWCITKSADAATTTFRIDFASPVSCATVVVAKWGNPSQTKIVSHGYNNCGSGGLSTSLTRIERAIQVNY